VSRAAAAVPYTAEDAKRELARRAKEELEKRRATPAFKAGVVRAIRAELFDRQLRVLDDPSPRIALLCSRRAGKSELAARMIAISLLESGHNVYTMFAARTLARARQIIFPLLEKMNDDYGLGWQMSAHLGQIATPDGAVFILLGVDDAVSIEKVRGSKYRLAVCDEAATYEALLERLVVDCLEPGTIDLKPRGRIVLAGTPSYAQAGYWFTVATGQKSGWSTHRWTLQDNPHIPDVGAALASIREANGWDESDPTYRREYLGQFVADESTLVYAVAEGRNTCYLPDLPQPPPGKTWDQWVREDWSVTVAADIGYVDAFAVIALGSPPHSKDMYALETATEVGLRAEQQAEYIQRFREKYRPERTVIDAGGQGKLVHGEFNQRFGKAAGGPAVAAQKMGKNEAIGMFNSDMRIGRIRALLPGALALYREWCELVWADTEKQRVNKHQSRNHVADACLYAWRAHRAYLAKAAPAEKTAEQLELEAQTARLKAAKGRGGRVR
jgi:hypothetical protein